MTPIFEIFHMYVYTYDRERFDKDGNGHLQVNSLEMTSHLYIYFFCIRPVFFLCQTWSSIQLDFLSFTRHIWISTKMNIQRVQWPSPTKAQTCHLQNFITLFGDLLFCQNHWNAFGSFFCTNQVVRYPKIKENSQELANVVIGAQGGGLRPCVAQAEGFACQHNCARLAQGIQDLSSHMESVYPEEVCRSWKIQFHSETSELWPWRHF